MDNDSIQQLVDQNYTITSAHTEFNNAIKKVRGSKKWEDIKDVKRAHSELKEAVKAFKIPTERKRQQSGDTPSTSKKQKVRHQSGVPTLEEIKESLVFDSSVPDSVADLVKAKTYLDKLELLNSWEKQSNRQTIRYAFHQGFYIDTICKSEFISTRTLSERTPVSLSELQRKRQLYTDLGDFRSLVYSTLPLYRIINNTKKIKQQLEKLSPSELLFWNNPILPNDTSGLLNCFINANQGQVLNKIYYQCDLYNNNIEEITIEQAVESLCIRLLTLSDAKTAEALIII